MSTNNKISLAGVIVTSIGVMVALGTWLIPGGLGSIISPPTPTDTPVVIAQDATATSTPTDIPADTPTLPPVPTVTPIPTPENNDPPPFQQARSKELSGFRFLISGDFSNALTAFTEAHEIYPTLHSIEEIKRLLEANKDALDNSEVQQEIIQTILELYTWEVPPEIIAELKAQSG